MIWVREHEQKRELRQAAPQTILTNFPDVLAPEGSFIINMAGPRELWRTALFARAAELGMSFPISWPYTYPLRYIMRIESELKGAQCF